MIDDSSVFMSCRFYVFGVVFTIGSASVLLVEF